MTSDPIPERSEAPEYYFKYIALVPTGDICGILELQLPETLAVLQQISDEGSRHRYAPEKWSIRQVLSHINDAERLFAFRAFWFARGFDSPLPSFEQNVAAQHASADTWGWSSHIEDFRAIRLSTLGLFRHLPADAWRHRGIVGDGHEFTVRAFAFIIAGHVVHHLHTLKQNYLRAPESGK